ncbi:MAG: SDR family oxidoreductase, partial [Pseudolabrys sp.]|nr:SDR family oxidoreductase [Pseudolabrys sp.]
MAQMSGLNGKAVVITGAGRGIGAACARGVAAQGAAVMVNDVDRVHAESVAREIVAGGGQALACIADITDWEAAGRLVQSCIDRFGRIDGLVNNAGLFHMGLLADFHANAARSLIEVNVLGAFHCAAHAVKPMIAQRSGSIVNVTSGAHLGNPAMGVYGASKGAIASMTYIWAMELAESGVRVNALSPLAQTRMMTDTADYTRSHGGDASRFADVQPPEANSPVVESLLSDRSIGISGQIVRIDRNELALYAHPAIQMPSVRSDGDDWTLDSVAAAFDRDLRERLVPCGILGTTGRAASL